MNRKQALTLFVLVLGTLMGALDSTIVLLAFPTIVTSLHANIATAIWIILIYLLVLGVTTTPLGRIGDIYGRSRLFISGFALFTVGSALCGFSTGIESLILFRGIQAFGGSLLQANSGAIIADVFARKERGTAFGFNSLGFTGGAMIGIVLGGLLTTLLGWQYIFFINIPIGIAAVILGIAYLKEVPRKKVRVDIVGAILLAIALSLISYGAVDFAGEGLTIMNLLFMIIGAAIIPSFMIYERKFSSPMVDFEALKDRVLKFSLSAAFIQGLGYFSVVFLLVLYLQGILGLTPLNASLLLIPGYVVGSFISPIMGRLADRYGSRKITTLGIIFLIVAILIYLTLRADSPLYTVLPGFKVNYTVLVGSAVAGLGTSMFFPANNRAVMSNVRAGSYGSISGLLRTLQNIGILGSFVIAISVASATIPRAVAFQIFIGTSNLSGDVSRVFVMGIDAALIVSLVLLVIAGILSFQKGEESISDAGAPGTPKTDKDQSDAHK